VLAARGLNLVDNLLVGRLEAWSAYDLGHAIDRPDAEAVVLSCTNWKTMEAIERLERELGKPVLSTTQVTLWAALRIVGGVEGIAGYGQLLRDLLGPGKETQFA
jgi:maleate cis-trans isomerase